MSPRSTECFPEQATLGLSVCSSPYSHPGRLGGWGPRGPPWGLFEKEARPLLAPAIRVGPGATASALWCLWGAFCSQGLGATIFVLSHQREPKRHLKFLKEDKFTP